MTLFDAPVTLEPCDICGAPHEWIDLTTWAIPGGVLTTCPACDHHAIARINGEVAAA